MRGKGIWCWEIGSEGRSHCEGRRRVKVKKTKGGKKKDMKKSVIRELRIKRECEGIDEGRVTGRNEEK